MAPRTDIWELDQVLVQISNMLDCMRLRSFNRICSDDYDDIITISLFFSQLYSFNTKN